MTLDKNKEVVDKVDKELHNGFLVPDYLAKLVGWLFWAYRPFETIFQSISGRLPERGRNKREMIDERKKCPNNPTRTYCKCSRPLPSYYSNQ